MLYNPWIHADELGMRVLTQEPGDDILGLYLGRGVIMLSPRLAYPAARCILAHEIVHAEAGHEPGTGNMHPAAVSATERECDRIATNRLIDPCALKNLHTGRGNNNLEDLAAELGVTLNVLKLSMKLNSGIR